MARALQANWACSKRSFQFKYLYGAELLRGALSVSQLLNQFADMSTYLTMDLANGSPPAGPSSGSLDNPTQDVWKPPLIPLWLAHDSNRLRTWNPDPSGDYPPALIRRPKPLHNSGSLICLKWRLRLWAAAASNWSTRPHASQKSCERKGVVARALQNKPSGFVNGTFKEIDVIRLFWWALVVAERSTDLPDYK